ncbi:MAG: SDR family NAD(P)-dependent oxidoreductase [Acetobacter sp.]|nr:SDR family NAD(P)-dependent oxidoreductase [Bacteroides sp.]MCM1341169.1 SDR family NAD(P)-dependent oxidoreductase [Acetobacter sp.]MCM1433497.1 SDR family NAD(P)-dependent oxidoreductase [Clostridiales bacterium]
MSNTCKCFGADWLSGKTVIVTGASGGMGAGIAATLIKKHGCRVVGVARSETKMLKFIEELGPDYASQFSYKLFDVSSKENWENFAAELAEEGIVPSVLINNAGILPKFKRFDRYSYDEIEKAMNINFYSCVYGVKTFLPVLLQQPDPAIINIDSSAALMTLAGTSMYSASKAALKGFTEAIRVEFKNKMYVGLVCPGFTKTDIFRDQKNDGGKGQKIMDMISTDCDLMVKMIMFGIEHKRPMMVQGVDAHAMSIFNRILPVKGSELFSAVMKAADIDLFNDVFKD